jgi:hypothetical protein
MPARPVGRLDPTAPRLDVGAVDRQAGQGRAEGRRVEGRQPLEPRDLARERPLRLLELRLGRDLGERAAVAGQLGQQLAEPLAPRRIDEHRARVAEELVPDRPADRPVAQLLRRLEDLLDPDAVNALGPQPREVAGRVGEAVRVVDPEAVDEPVAHEVEHAAMGRLEDIRVLLAQRRQVVDVEEAPVAPGRVQVEELRLQLRVGPPAILLAHAHVVRDDVEHDPEPCGRQARELLLAAEVRAQAGRVDDVVAVRRARPRLQRRRQVDVADAEPLQVGDELADAREVHPRAELEPVGAAERARQVSVRAVGVGARRPTAT